MHEIFYFQMLRRARTIGVGRHTKSVVGDIGKDDIRAISKYLGDKKFIFGDQMTAVM